jgi:hypothetical protein
MLSKYLSLCMNIQYFSKFKVETRNAIELNNMFAILENMEGDDNIDKYE